MSALSDIATAVRLLTILPAGSAEGAHPTRWFAAVGWLLGLLAASMASLAVWLGVDSGTRSLVAGALIVASWAVVSGFLHHDGLADLADAIGSRGDRERRLAVMRDSNVGAFGVTAVVLLVLVEVVSVAAIVESRAWWALGAAPVLGRYVGAVALSALPAARPEGLAAGLCGRESAGGALVAMAPVLLLLAVQPTVSHVLVVAAACVLGATLASAFSRPLGGVTGDVVGATILLTEAFVLVIAALGGLS